MDDIKKYYFLKLIPPRPSFIQDITPEEREIMNEHAAYWREIMKRGICIVYGPVLDPNGAYGISVLEIEDEHFLAEIQENDPSLKSGLNRLEIYPMNAIVKRL